MISRERVETEWGLMTGRIKKTFRNGKANISNFQSNLSEKTRRVARKTDYYVHDNAWRMMAVTAGVAFAAGFVLSRGNQQAVLRAAGDPPNPQEKVKKMNSWEILRSSLPLALFLWKAYQVSRDQRRAKI